LAGFQVTTIGRFWVTAEVISGLVVEIKPSASESDITAAAALVKAMESENFVVGGAWTMTVGAIVVSQFGSMNREANVRLTVSKKP